MSAETEEIWSQIRATRANPPAPAKSSPERRHTYGTALEQAQQMFRAGAAVGPETQPLLIFYGLSQAGRAIAAASASPSADGEGWRLRGHGIHARKMDGPLADIQIVSDGPGRPGSFVRLSEILDSPLFSASAGVRLEDVWDCIPDNHKQPLSANGTRRRMPLNVSRDSLREEPSRCISVLVHHFPPSVVDSPEPRQALDDYLSAFPDVSAYRDIHRTTTDANGAPNFIGGIRAGWGSLLMHWPMPDETESSLEERLAHLRTMVRPHRGGWWFFPGIGSTGASSHPLMAWWAVLHALSMLARYEPDQWARHINVDLDGSRAVAIEQLLRRALTTVPQLIAETIAHVAEPAA